MFDGNCPDCGDYSDDEVCSLCSCCDCTAATTRRSKLRKNHRKTKKASFDAHSWLEYNRRKSTRGSISGVAGNLPLTKDGRKYTRGASDHFVTTYQQEFRDFMTSGPSPILGRTPTATRAPHRIAGNSHRNRTKTSPVHGAHKPAGRGTEERLQHTNNVNTSRPPPPSRDCQPEIGQLVAPTNQIHTEPNSYSQHMPAKAETHVPAADVEQLSNRSDVGVQVEPPSPPRYPTYPIHRMREYPMVNPMIYNVALDGRHPPAPTISVPVMEFPKRQSPPSVRCFKRDCRTCQEIDLSGICDNSCLSRRPDSVERPRLSSQVDYLNNARVHTFSEIGDHLKQVTDGILRDESTENLATSPKSTTLGEIPSKNRESDFQYATESNSHPKTYQRRKIITAKDVLESNEATRKYPVERLESEYPVNDLADRRRKVKSSKDSDSQEAKTNDPVDRSTRHELADHNVDKLYKDGATFTTKEARAKTPIGGVMGGSGDGFGMSNVMSKLNAISKELYDINNTLRSESESRGTR